MRIRRKKGRRIGEAIPKLPLIAFVDVVLFFLLYFLMAGSLAEPESELASGLKTDRGSGKGSDFAVQILFVEGTPAGPQFRLGSRTFTDRPSLLPVLSSLPKDRGIIVKTTNSATVGGAAAAVQTCKDAGFDKVSYVPGSTDSKPQTPRSIE